MNISPSAGGSTPDYYPVICPESRTYSATTSQTADTSVLYAEAGYYNTPLVLGYVDYYYNVYTVGAGWLAKMGIVDNSNAGVLTAA